MQAYKEFGGTYDEKIKDMKLWHNTLFIIGDIQSWYTATGEARTSSLPYVYSTFAMRINVDLLDLNCFKTAVTINSTFYQDATGNWKSSTYLFPFQFENGGFISIRR